MIHLSDIKKYDRCEKLYWLSQKQPEKFLPFVFYNESIIELSKKLLHIEEYFEGHVGDEGDQALHALQEHTTLINARFAYKDIRIKVPIMTLNNHRWIMYFTYSSCYPKEHEAQIIADSIHILNLLNVEVKDVYIIHLNADYIREDDLNIEQLLIITKFLYNHKNKPHKTVEELIPMYTRDISMYNEILPACLEKDEVSSIRRNICTRGNKCTYIDTCFEQPKQDTSLLYLVTSAKKYEMMEEGITDIKDVDIDRIEGTRHQYAQIMAAKQNGFYMDYIAVKTWVDHSITYPISYLDFEWETYAFPPYHGMKPFDVLCFQYSLHIEIENEIDLIHKEYLGTKDCRVEFIESLIKDVPEVGTILVFNMEGAEKLRLKQLSVQFPQYAKELDAICNRMVDLSLPFSSANIYDDKMHGLFSLKTLVSVFSDYSYQDLDITYGMDAVRNWRMLENQDQEAAEEIRKHLLAYCAMDTYAEYIVFHAILDKLKAVYD